MTMSSAKNPRNRFRSPAAIDCEYSVAMRRISNSAADEARTDSGVSIIRDSKPHGSGHRFSISL
jgi:hypothetical protein